MLHSVPAPPQVSTTVLRRMLRALPHLRDSLVGAAASFPARISEDYVEVGAPTQSNFLDLFTCLSQRPRPWLGTVLALLLRRREGLPCSVVVRTSKHVLSTAGKLGSSSHAGGWLVVCRSSVTARSWPCRSCASGPPWWRKSVRRGQPQTRPRSPPGLGAGCTAPRAPRCACCAPTTWQCAGGSSPSAPIRCCRPS